MSNTSAPADPPTEDDPVFDDEAITAIIVGAICLGVLIVLIGMCLVTIWYFSVEKRQARKEEKQKEKRRLENETRQMLDGDDEETIELGLLGAEGAASAKEFSAIDISDVEDGDDDDLDASKRRSKRRQQQQRMMDDGSSSDDGLYSPKRRQSPGREGNTLADYIAKGVKGGIPEDAVLEDAGPGIGIRITEVKGLADTLIPIDEAMRRSYFDDSDINVDGKDIPADDTSPEAIKRRKDKDAFYKRQEGKLKYIQDLRAKKEEFEKKEGRFKNITAARTPEEVAAEKRMKLEEEELDRLIEEADKEEDVPLSRAEAERKRIQYLNDREFKRWVLENQEEKSHRIYGGANAEQAIARRLLSTTYYTAADPFRSRAEEAQEERRNREKAQEVAEKLHTLRLKQHQLATQHRALQQRPQTENEDLNKKLRMALAGMTAGLRKLASEIEDVESDLREAAGVAVKSKGGTVDGISNQDLITSLLGAAAAERITRWTSGEEALGGEDEAGAGPARRDQHTAASTFPLHELPWMTADAVQALAKQVRSDNKKQIKAQRSIEPFFQNNGTLDFEHPVSRKQLTDARRNSVMGGAGSDRGSAWGDRSSYDGGGNGTRRERGSTILGSETGSANDRASSHGSGRTKSVFYGNNSAFDGSDRGSIFGGSPGGGDNFSQGGGGRGGRRKHVEALPNSAFTPQLLKASHEILAEREGMFGPNARAKRAAAAAKAAAEEKEVNSDGEISNDSDDDNERVGRSTNVEFMLGISKQKLVDKRSLAAMREQLVNNVRRLEEELEEEGRDKEHDISLADEQLLQQLSPSARAREAAEGGMRGVASIKDQKTAARKRAQVEKHAKKCRRKLFKLLILQKRLEEEEVKEAKRKRRNRGRSTVGNGSSMNNNASFGGDTKSIISGTDRDSSPGSGRGSVYGSGRGSVYGSDRDSRGGFDGGGGGGFGGRENGNDPKTPEDAMAALQRHLEQHEELKKLAVEDLEDEFGAIDDQLDMSSVDASSNDSADGWLNIGKDDDVDEREEEAITKGLGGRVGWVRPEERKWFHTSRSPENRLKGAERVSNAQRLDGEGGGGGAGGRTLHDRLLLLEQEEKQLEDARKARRRDERLKSRAARAVEGEDLPEPLPMYEADIEWGRNTYAERMKNKRGGLDETDMLPTRVVRALPRAEDDPYLYLL